MELESFTPWILTTLCNLQGINRLGKAPPRPGSLRPPDPNRNRVLDIYSEGTEGDADYMRMVQDVSTHRHAEAFRMTLDARYAITRLSFLATVIYFYLVQIEDAQQSQVGWLFGRGGEDFEIILLG